MLNHGGLAWSSNFLFSQIKGLLLQCFLSAGIAENISRFLLSCILMSCIPAVMSLLIRRASIVISILKKIVIWFFLRGCKLDYVIRLLSTIVCEKLIDLGIIKSWYYNGNFVVRYARREFVLTFTEKKITEKK